MPARRATVRENPRNMALRGARTATSGYDGLIPPRAGLPAHALRTPHRNSSMAEKPLDRRKFFGSAAALSLSAAGYANVLGSNERLGVGFLGCGARAQAHI